MSLEAGYSLLLQILMIFSTFVFSFIYWLYRRQDYFKNLKIPFYKSVPLLGAFMDTVSGKMGLYENVVKIYNHPDVKDEPFFGFFLFHKPALMINDVELIKRILVKDSSSFLDRYSSGDTHDPLGYNGMFGVKNPLWKKIRGKISPFFSSGKLKMMFYIVEKISDGMVKHVEKKLDENGEVELELKELASLYTTDVIASAAFGVDAKSLENPNGEFREAGRAIVTMTFWRGIEFTSTFFLPQIMKLFNFKVFSEKGSKFIQSTIPQVIEARKKSGRKFHDLIDTMIALKEEDETLSDDVLMAQAAVFLTAGFEASSATQSFALYEIAKDKTIQDKVRDEIFNALSKSNGTVSYDLLMSNSEMPYLHQIVQETMRLYAVFPTLDRKCIDPEGYSLKPFSDLKIPQGMPIFVPIYAIQRDEKYFPNPSKFDPERFAPENLNKIAPYTNSPFGFGPRNCIGERFALMQVKAGIVKTLMNFRVEPTENTPTEIVLEKRAMLIQSEKGLVVKLVKDPLLPGRRDRCFAN